MFVDAWRGRRCWVFLVLGLVWLWFGFGLFWLGPPTLRPSAPQHQPKVRSKAFTWHFRWLRNMAMNSERRGKLGGWDHWKSGGMGLSFGRWFLNPFSFLGHSWHLGGSLFRPLTTSLHRSLRMFSVVVFAATSAVAMVSAYALSHLILGLDKTLAAWLWFFWCL